METYKEKQIKAFYLTYLVTANRIIPKNSIIYEVKKLLEIKSPLFNFETLLKYYNENVSKYHHLGMQPHQLLKILNS